MKREYLKGLGLEDSVIDGIMAEHGRTVSDLNNQLGAERNKVTERDNQIDTLKSSGGDAEALKKQVETLQQENQAKDAQLAKTTIDNQVANTLRDAGAVNVTAVRALLAEQGELALDKDGKVAGLDDMLNKVKEANAWAFVETKPKDTPPINFPGNPDPKTGTQPMTMDDALKITDFDTRIEAIAAVQKQQTQTED